LGRDFFFFLSSAVAIRGPAFFGNGGGGAGGGGGGGLFLRWGLIPLTRKKGTRGNRREPKKGSWEPASAGELERGIKQCLWALPARRKGPAGRGGKTTGAPALLGGLGGAGHRGRRLFQTREGLFPRPFFTVVKVWGFSGAGEGTPGEGGGGRAKLRLLVTGAGG